ncbi:hypothetical protein I6F50_19820 [Pseudoalteromonas sp. NZS127_1]|uniref:hypothetical protein n=1 Tax=Pseudoalteromonas sp. NZS127_1 TaxID=2792074 RepID=UPI0018CD7CD1|nr:hypothetical protein [Pseudoalteromonas sp. NZS127_1]MBG9997282.1 hypothetical protein [Pseudoalteromonas sp. NZS127_1]
MDLNTLFFPKLSRHPKYMYHSNNGDFYAASNYQSNYDIIAENCKHRCVYCDATEKECGGERFSLDHFRPKDIFVNKFNGILLRHPYNLHLSCQKCNVLKSKDWQGCQITIDGYSYALGKGYVDRFQKDILKYMYVQENGRIAITESNIGYAQNPAKYMIERLHLNRPNRVYLRQQRVIKQLSRKIDSLLAKLTAETIQACDEGHRTPAKSMKRIAKIETQRDKFRAIVT